jgi:LysR family transcriptional regulator, low CO2-responsive transcriptional regulator
MKLHQLRIFESISRNLSMTAAAAELCMSQPAVSLQLKLLEEEYGVSLFERNKHGMDLTDKGRHFLESALVILEGIEQLELKFKTRGSEKTALLIVGVSHVLSMTIVPDILMKYREQCPHVQLELTIGSSHWIESRVEESKVDIGLINNPKVLPHCEYETFQETQQEAVVVVPASGHELSDRVTVTLQELVRHPLIVRAGSPLIEELNTRLFNPVLALQCNAPESVRMGIRRGLGIGLVTKSWVKAEIDSGELAVINLPEIQAYTFHSYIVRNRRRNPSTNEEKFIAAVREEAVPEGF